MCVIIYREPKITIPFAKLESACKVNADGMGVVVHDRGKIEVRKFFDPKGNDPDVLAKYLEQAKDNYVYVHLRYKTRGATDKDNVHPFGVLTQKKHGFDMQFMHNGTLSDFGNAKTCDSKDFAKSFLQPLAERFLKAMDKEKVIHDPVFVSILEKYAGKASVFLLNDSYGSHQIINFANGKEFDGWWASNEYSFNQHHRTNTSYSSPGWDRKQHWKDDSFWDEKNTTKPTVVSLPTPKQDTPPFDDEPDVTKEVANKSTTNPTSLPRRRQFIEEAKLSSLADVCHFSYDDVCDLIDDFPEDAAMLICDLIYELWGRDIRNAEDSDVAEEVRVA